VIGLWSDPNWVLISLVAAVLIAVFAYNDIRAVTRSLLGIEAISVALVTILIVVIFVKVIGGSAANGQDFTLKPFVPESGTTIGAIAFASVFGLLSFGGFEGAARPRSRARSRTRSPGAARLLFALGRDGFVTTRLGEASRRTGAPANSLAVVMVFAVVVGVALYLNDRTAVNAFFYMGTIGVLSMLIAYIVTNVGALRFLHLGRREALWRAIIPILAITALVYTLYKNVWPRPAHPYDLFLLIVGGWLIVGAAVTVAFPGFARRIGVALSEAEGIKGAEMEPGRPGP
jgi:amino acid transporter